MPYASSFPIKWFISCLLIFLSNFVQGEEKLFFPLDDRTWQIGFEAKVEDEKLIELILQNEEITNWSELFTVQLFENFSLSAADFVTILERSSKDNLPSQEDLDFKIINKDPLNIFESSFIFNQNKENPTTANNEYNIGRVIKGKTTLYYLHYSTKDARLFKQNKEAWIQRFKLAYTASVPHENHKEKWITLSSKGIYENGKQWTYQVAYQFIENKNAGYSLSIPKTWSMQKVEKSRNVGQPPLVLTESLTFSSPDQSIEGKVILMDLPEESSLKVTSQQYYNIYKKEHPQVEVLTEGNIQTIIGQDAHYLILVNEGKKEWITFMCINKRCYCLELWTKREQFNDLRQTLEKIILNFQTRSFQ